MIKNKTLKFEYPSPTVYLVEIGSKETANGEILLKVDGLTEILTSAASIFLVTPPTVLNSKWLKTGLDLKTDPIFTIAQLRVFSGEIKLFWRFDALELSAEDGQFYTVNININGDSDSGTAQADIVFNIKINDIAIVEA